MEPLFRKIPEARTSFGRNKTRSSQTIDGNEVYQSFVEMVQLFSFLIIVALIRRQIQQFFRENKCLPKMKSNPLMHFSRLRLVGSCAFHVDMSTDFIKKRAEIRTLAYF